MATSTDPVIAGPQVAVTKPGGVAGPTASLTFTPANWNVAQTLHVFPVDDDYDEADTHPWTLQATMTSSAPGFNSATLRRFVIDQAELEGPATVDATITDDDTSAFDVRNTGADTTVLENVSGDKVDVRLATHPYATVDVTVTASSRCTVNGGASTTVTVLAGDWNVAHLVDVAAVDNNALEGPKQCQLTFDATSTDALYDDLDPITKDVDIVDDEVPGVDVKTDDGVAVSETGTTDTFQVVLRAQPTADVTVDLFDDQTLTVSGVTFTPANWNTPKIVTVAADDDDIDEDDPHPGEVVMGVTSTAYGFSTAPVYDVDSVETKTIPVSVGDDDEAGFTLSTTSLTLAEAGSADTFTLQLMSEPIADVTVTPTATGLCTSSPTTLTFTAADWDTPQTVTVTPGSDDIDHAQSCKVSSAVTSTDPKYASKGITDVTGAVTDDDTAGVTPSKTSLTLAEGGVADSYTLVLDSEPTADVKITPAATGLCTVGGFLTFTAANWDAPQTVTVTPGTDAVDQDATCTIGHTAASTDATYAGFAVADVSGAVTDDDTAAVTLSKTALTLAEGGAADTYTIVLATQPTADVVVTPTATGLCTVSGPLTFTAADWSTAQTVTVTPGNDSLYKPQSCTITHATTTTDAAYDAVVVADASGALEEDETSVVTLSKVALTLTEAGPADTYTIELVLPPTADVVVDLAATGLCSVGPGQVTFTTANWNVARTITVTPGSDDVVHAQECTVSHTTASDDATYDAIVVEDAKGAVVDDDVASVETSQDALTLTESGADDTYTVVLTSKPSGDVTVAFAATGLCSVSPSSRTFTSANWDEPQPVAVTPGDDDIVHVQSCSIGHTVTSTDTNYDGVNPAALSGAVAEDDTAGVTVSDTSLTLVEGGADDTYSVELTSEPLSSVTVTVAASGLCSALPATLTFTAADWDQAQTVTVTPGDDDIVHAQSCTVTQTAASGDGSYDGTAVADPTGPVVEDDTASVDLTGAALTLTESGAADTYTIVLGSEPTADVVVTPTAAGLCSATGALTFTPADWDTAQTVTVTPGDDDIVHAQSCTVSHAVASADATYAAITPADASGAVADDDTAGVVLSKTALTLAEAGAADTYTVRLTSEPVSDVVIGVADTGLCAATPATLTFTDADWDTAQTVTVTPGSDDIVHAQPCTVAHDATSSDPAYDGIAVEDASGGVSDDDTAGATASKTTLALAEAGAADTYTLVLASEPTDDVEITLTATGLCSVAPGSITFTSHTWDTAQTVTVTPGEDDIVHAQSCSIGHAVASDDPAYDGLVPATVAGAVTDDDTAGVALSGTALELDESGDDDTYTAALTSQPASDVTVAVAAGGLCASSPASLTFTAADWDVPQTITVTPGDDDIVHAQSCTVSHTVTSADADYDGATVTDATGPVVDDDTAGVDASKDGLTLTESGPADTYSVVLTSEPTADVVVTPTASGLCSVSGSLTFTAADWDVPQTITVTPGDDDVVHAQSCSIGHASASADPAYTGLQIGAVGGAVVDDDTAGVEVVAGPVVLHEATPATTDTYTVALASEPLADVTVAITTADGQTSADRADLTFTAADWDVPQAVTLTVVDDATLEASPHDGVVAHATSSTDPAYGPTVAITVDGAAGDEMTASIGDDETATDLALSAPADDETSVTATATVTGGDDPRTGTVQFALDGTEVGLPVALTGDTAELDLGILAVGPHEVSATYGGDSLHDGSADTATTEVGIVARAAGDAVELAEDGDALVDVLANDKGVDDVEGWTQGAHGAVDCTAAGCTYTPDADFNGTDAFTYQATDGSDVTDPATVEVTVTAVNDAPEPGVVSVSVVSGESVTFDVLDGATDVDGDPITVSAHGQPAHGTVACTPAGSCTYTPEPGYTGTDSFTYTLSDGTGEVAAQAVRAVRAGSTSTGTATITVEAAPTPPTTPDPGSPGPGTDPNGPGGTGGVGGTGGTGTGTGGPLPRTGTDPRSLVALGAVLLAVGALVLRVRRRPTPTSTP
ncbi:MAG TPA: Ig-like domain-containing protein [Aquihabitans sp.]|nr:Ig-like domain-containing protein [Aquihabitans sp.]